MHNDNEIRCYGNPKIINGFIGVMAAYPVAMIVVSIFNGRLVKVWPLIALISLALWLWWIASRKGTFIVVDRNRKTLQASNFFIRTRRVPIEAITRIGTRGMFVGAATEIEITYRKPNGRERTLGYGTMTFLNPADLHTILDALIAINSTLRLPPELRKV